MRWSVYDKTGKIKRCEVQKVEYNGVWMGERGVTSSIESQRPIGFEVFDYIEYRGEKFELELVPEVKKTSSDKYSYDLRFVSLKYELERCLMRDIVPNDNGIVYPTPLNIEFTGDVKYLVERIQACLDDMYGKGTWTLSVSEGTESEEKNIIISNQNCWNALALVNSEYGLNYYISGRTVTVGGEGYTISHVFEYGKGKGLYEIERVSDSGTGVVTKLRAYGGSRNLDYSYPKYPEWEDSVLPVNYALSPLRLMLPSFKLDGKTDYVLASDEAVKQYGIREGSITYDDIFPTLTGATNQKGERIDRIRAVDPIGSDTQPTFTVYLYDLEFDLQESLTTEAAQLSMKTGTLQGYAFNISALLRYSDGSYRLELERHTVENTDTDNFTVPNKDWNMKAGDEFVLLNILMPKKYVTDAENRLLQRAKEYLQEYAKTNFLYNVGIDELFMKRNVAFYNELMEGKKLTVNDSHVGISNESIIIQSLTITEGEGLAPTFKVSLNNKSSAGTLDRIQGQIGNIESTVNNTFSSATELGKQYKKKLDKATWDSAFRLYHDDEDNPTKVTRIEALSDFFGKGGISALGYEESSGGGGGGLIETVYSYSDLGKTFDPLDNTSVFNADTTSRMHAEVVDMGVDLKNKVDKVSGYGLSKNDFTDALKAKLDGLKNYVLPVAGTDILGGIMAGSTVTIGADGVLNLKQSGVVSGTYSKVTVDEYGRVTSGTSLSHTDIPALPISKITGLQGELDNKVDNSDFDSKFDKAMGRWWVRDAANKALRPADYDKEAVNIYSNGGMAALGYEETAGGGGGASSLGQLTNVGAWADETPSFDRVMVQLKDSTHWSSKPLSDLIPSLDGYATESWVTGKGYATVTDVDNRIDALVNGAPEAFDTLKEIADVLQGNVDSIGDIITALGTKADKSIKIIAGTGLTGGGDLTTSRTFSLATTGVKAGTYTKLTVDTYGRVTSATNLAQGDIPELAISKITGLQTALDGKVNNSDFNDKFDEAMKRWWVRDVSSKALRPADYDGNPVNIYSDGGVSALGYEDTPGGGGGGLIQSVYGYSDLGKSFDANNYTETFNADAIGRIHAETVRLGSAKVDKVSGYGLSKNDFTDTLKAKLDGLKNYVLPVAKAATLGGIMIGSTLTADASGVLNLKTSGVAAGTYQKVTVDSYGRVTSGAGLTSTDIPALSWNKITSDKPTTLAGYGITDSYTSTSIDDLLSKKAAKATKVIAGTGLSGGGDLSTDRTLSLAASGVAKGTYTKLTVDTYGRATSGTGLSATDIPTLSISKISGLQTALDSKLSISAFNDMFEKVNIGTASAPVYVIRANYSFFSRDGVSALGYDETAGGGGSGSLSELADVNVSGLKGGDLLVYNSTTTHWENRPQSSIVPDMSNYVTLNTSQFIKGTKTFDVSIAFNVDNYTGGWARGLHYRKGDTLLGGFGGLGGQTTAGSFQCLYMGLGTTPWVNNSLRAYADKLVTDLPLEAKSVKVTGGTAAQFMKANGTLDSSTYATTTALGDYVTLATDQTIGGKKAFTQGVFFQASDLDNKAFLYNNRIAFGGITARGVNVGSLLISDAWADVDKVGYAGLYVKGPAKVRNLVIHNTEGIAHLQFSRGGYNYITAPANGYMAFVPNGKGVSVVNSDLAVYDKLVFPGTTDTVWLGNASYRWHSVVSKYGNFSGQITSEVADGTAPFSVKSTTMVENLNSHLLNGYLYRQISGGAQIYNATNGCLVRLTALATAQTMIIAHIWGNNYGNDTVPYDTTIQFYNYPPDNTIYWSAAVNNGASFGDITVFNYDGRIYMWFKQPRASQSFHINVYGGNLPTYDLVESISNAALPTTGVTRKKVITPKQSALTTDNVASATKLETRRSLWGQLFDGTENVSGNLSNVGNITAPNYMLDTTDTNPYLRLHVSDKEVFYWVQAFGNYLYVGNGTSKAMMLDGNGNVKIGSGSINTSWKLQVDGNSWVNGNLFVGSAIDGTYLQIGEIRLVYDVANNALKVIKNNGTTANFYVTGGLSALGYEESSGGGGFDRLDSWSDYTPDKYTYALSAGLGVDLNNRITSIETNGATSVAKSGNGELVAGLSKSKNVITYSMGFATKIYTHDLRNDKPNSQALSIQRVATPFFMSAGNLGVGSNYYDAVYFNTYSDTSGGWTNLIALSKNPTVEYADMYIAKQAQGSTDWGKKVRVITDYNYTTYTVTKTGTGASGDWAIGSKYLSMYTSSDFENFLQDSVGTYAYLTSGASNYPEAYGMGIRLQRQPKTNLGDSQILLDIYTSSNNNDDIWVSKSKGNSSTNKVTYGKWLKLLHSENFNAYAPKLDGTGANGYWGITSGSFGTSTLRAVLENGNELNFIGTSTTVDGLNLYIGYPRSGRLSPTNFFFKNGSYEGIVHAKIRTPQIINTSPVGEAEYGKLNQVIVVDTTDSNKYKKMDRSTFRSQILSWSYNNNVLDLSGLDGNKWYPCSISLGRNYYTTIEFSNVLDGTTNKPDWSTHAQGFTMNLSWEAMGGGWGATQPQRKILNYCVQFAGDKSPCGGIEQNTMASVEIVYLRGGAKYTYRCTPSGSFTVHSSGYSWSSGSYSYSAPVLNAPKMNVLSSFSSDSIYGVYSIYGSYIGVNNRIGFKGKNTGNAWANIFNPLNACMATEEVATVSDAGTVQPMLYWKNRITKANGTNVGYVTHYAIGSVRGITDYGKMVFLISNNDAGTAGVSYGFNYDGTVSITGNYFKFNGPIKPLYTGDNSIYATMGPENGSYVHMRTNTAIGWYFEKNVDVVGRVSPYADNAYACGQSAKRWSNVYSVAMNASSHVDIGNARLYWDSANNAIRVSTVAGGAMNFYVTGGLSALGFESTADSGAGGLIQNVYNYSGLSNTFSDADMSNTFNAYTVKRIHDRVYTLETNIRSHTYPITPYAYSELDKLNTPTDNGLYSIKEGNLYSYELLQTTDNMAHVLNQYLFTNQTSNKTAELDSAHSDILVGILYRTYNFNGVNISIPRKTWGNWYPLIQANNTTGDVYFANSVLVGSNTPSDVARGYDLTVAAGGIYNKGEFFSYGMATFDDEIIMTTSADITMTNTSSSGPGIIMKNGNSNATSWTLYGNYSDGSLRFYRLNKSSGVSGYIFQMLNTGNCKCYGTIQQSAGSDMRLKHKEDFKVDYAQRLLDMGIVFDYEYNDLAFKLDAPSVSNGRHTGLYYHNAKAVLPQMARTFKGDYGSLDYTNTDYINLIAGATQLNTLGLRSLTERTESLESKVERLERENNELRQKIAKLEEK